MSVLQPPRLLKRELFVSLLVPIALVLATSLLFNSQQVAPELRPWSGLAIVFFLPGFLLSQLLFPGEDNLGIAALPVSVVFSLVILGIPAVLVRVLRFDWAVYTIIFLLIIWGEGILYVLRLWLRPDALGVRSAATSLPSRHRTRVALLILAGVLVLTMAMVYRGARQDDDWFYLAAVQQIVHYDRFAESIWGARYSLRFLLHAWLFLQAFVARGFQVEAVLLERDILPTLVAPLSLIALFAWARQLTRRNGAALIAVLFQFAIYSMWVNFDDWGNGFFARSAQDKFVVWLLVFPITMLFFWRWMERGAWQDWLAFGLTLIASGLVHPIELAQVALVLLGFALLNLLMRPFSIKRWLLVAAWFAPVFALGVIYRVVSAGNLFSLSPEEAGFYYRASSERLIFEPPLLYLAHPNLLAQPLLIFALALLPLTARALRRSRRVQFLWGSTLVPLALLYTPLTARLIGEAITPWQLWRLTWILPVSLIVAELATRLIASGSARLSLNFVLKPAPIFVLGALTVALGLGNTSVVASWRNLTGSHALTPEVEQLMRALPTYITQPSYVMLPRPLAPIAPAFTADAQIIAPTITQVDDPFGAETDQFYSQKLIQSLGILKRYEIRFIIVAVDSSLYRQFESKPGLFARRYANNAYALYALLQNPIDPGVLSENPSPMQ